LNAAELFVQCLENEGVTRVFGVPGEENAALMMALDASSIDFILTRHEQGAAFMAEATVVSPESPECALEPPRTRSRQPRHWCRRGQHGPCSTHCNHRLGRNRTVAQRKPSGDGRCGHVQADNEVGFNNSQPAQRA